MADLLDRDRVQSLARVLFVAYLLVLAYAVLSGDPLADLALDLAFVAAMLGFAAFLLDRHGTATLPLATAGVLAAAGLAQAAGLATGNARLDTASSVLLLVGLGLYLYLRRG